MPGPGGDSTATSPTRDAREIRDGIADGLLDARGAVRAEVDPLDRAVVRARVAGALFDRPAAPVTVGRFHVLERVGRGGMGVVYAAYDPDLDRRVALKLVPAEDGGVRARLLAEAQALARLSHPNVVPVHDVDVIGDQVCIVMEYVRGDTLRGWCAAAPRSWRDIVDVYRQVGDGLDAAHRAGLVHRDVKPDNAIVGSDGRVRIVDFGLARAVCTPAEAAELAAVVTRPGGTPRYMAPEQRSGGPVTAAADQYAFCVSLRESLGSAEPRWLTPLLDRGAAADPAARFPSMAELGRALARDPARVRRQRIAAAAAGVLLGTVAGGAYLAGRGVEVAGDACSGGAAAIAQVWSPASHREVADHLVATGRYGAALAPRLAERVDGYAATWARGHRAACEAHRRGEQSPALLDRRMACLEHGRSALGALVDVLRAADAAALPDAALAAAELPRLARCDDAGALLASSESPPPAVAADVARLDGDVARAQVLFAAGRAEDARALAADAAEAARRTGHLPLLARALLARGRAEMGLDPRLAAAAPLREATAVALRAGDDAVAVEAFARRAWVEGTSNDSTGDPLAGLPEVAAIAERAAGGEFARALLHNNVGSVHLGAGRRDRARAELETALAIAREVPAPAPVELANIRGNLALVVDEPARRAALRADAIAQLTAQLGDDHPMTLDARINAGLQSDDAGVAETALPPLCAAMARLHPVYGAKIAECWFEVGWLAYRGGALSAAREAFAQALAAGGTAPEEVALNNGYLALARGDAAAAVRSFAQARAAVAATVDDPWWTRELAGEAELGLALARRQAGDRRAAAEAFAAAEAWLAPVVATQRLAKTERRLAYARAARGGQEPNGLAESR